MIPCALSSMLSSVQNRKCKQSFKDSDSWPIFQAPETGIYYFYLAGDEQCALYLSTNDKGENKKRIIFLTDGMNTKKEEWDKWVTSAKIMIEA